MIPIRETVGRLKICYTKQLLSTFTHAQNGSGIVGNGPLETCNAPEGGLQSMQLVIMKQFALIFFF